MNSSEDWNCCNAVAHFSYGAQRGTGHRPFTMPPIRIMWCEKNNMKTIVLASISLNIRSPISLVKMNSTFLVQRKKHGNVLCDNVADKNLLDTGKHGNMLLSDLMFSKFVYECKRKKDACKYEFVR